MQIICVTHAYPRWDGDVAGVFIERLVLALVTLGHQLRVVAPADRGRGGREHRHGVPVWRVRYAPARWETLAYRGTMTEAGRSPRGLVALAGLLAGCARTVRRLHALSPADMVHAHWWVPAGLSAWRARQRGGPPYVVTLHGTDVAILDRSRLARWAAPRVLRGARAVTAVSSYLAARAQAVTGLDPARVIVQPMPVDVERYRRRSRGGGGVMTVGRLVRQKRIHLVLGAIAHLRREGWEVPLTVIGDGPERAALEREAARLAITDVVRFVGAVEPAQLPDALGDADVLAFPAAREGFGLAAAEAFMLGIPVVAAADGGGVTDIVPPVGAGRIVPGNDVPALAAAIRGLATSSAAREAAAQRGDELKAWLAPAGVAAAFEGIYASRALGR